MGQFFRFVGGDDFGKLGGVIRFKGDFVLPAPENELAGGGDTISHSSHSTWGGDRPGRPRDRLPQ